MSVRYNEWVMRESINNLLGPKGRFAKLCDGYEHREEQVRMAEAVADALLHKEHLLVEAGTGVGKTVAYLTPAILNSLDGRPVVVSTHTINLQSQLITKDIPLMQSVMDEHPFKAVLMKGRGNFICLQELDHAQASLPFEDAAFERLKKWVKETETGDVAELDFSFPDWSEVCCNVHTCKGRECPYNAEQRAESGEQRARKGGAGSETHAQQRAESGEQRARKGGAGSETHAQLGDASGRKAAPKNGGLRSCFYYKRRREANSADIVVVNHALFMADLSLKMVNPREGVLPDYGAVIFDEAHHLEDVATDAFGIEFSNYRIPMLLNRIKKRRDIVIEPGELQFIESVNNTLFDTFNRMRKSEFFFDELYESEGRTQVEKTANELLTTLDSLNTQLAGQDTEGNPELKDRVDGYRRMLASMRGELGDLFFGDQPNYFRWAQKPSNSKRVSCYLHFTPVNVAELFEEHLWSKIESIVCTSATLSNSGTFCYLKNRLGAPDCNELLVGSPFDFMSQSLLYVPDDLDFPSDTDEYRDALAERIKEILLATEGRAFMLFTSYRMMNAAFDRLVNQVPYRLLVQGDMSNERLIKEFREDENACLMGVHSFWEGVDVKGERLSCVIIDKLPFAVPDTPTNKARCERIEAEGGNWFMEYAVPQAQIRLKQGFGRLIRTKSDYGIVAILDCRIHRKFYGKEFLKYLPRCKGTKSVSKLRSFLGSFEPYDGGKFAAEGTGSRE